jgi:hypothetical protein
LQADHLMRLYQLTEQVIKLAAGMQGESNVEPARGDRRFNATEWRDNSLHSLRSNAICCIRAIALISSKRLIWTKRRSIGCVSRANSSRQ